MGLETVELVMAVEDEFGIAIPVEDGRHLGVLGDLADYVVQSLRSRGESPDENEVWKRLKVIVIRQLGVRPEEVTRTAHVVYDLHVD